MSTLDPRYFITADLEEYFVDKSTGLPLANGTLNFFSASDGITPKPVFELVGPVGGPWSYASLGATVTLSAVGTVQDSGGNNVVIYYYPYDAEGELELYYVQCFDSVGNMQFTRTAWPNISTSTNSNTVDNQFNNQISNPQFAEVFINNTDSLSSTFTVGGSGQTFALGPEWTFVCSGSGTVVVKQVPQAGSAGTPTSPPYVLDINVSPGVTSCFLRQRFSTNSGLWASITAAPSQNIFLSTSLTAGNQNGGNVDIQMYYNESTGGSPLVIFDNLFPNGGLFTKYGIASQPLAQIPASTNPDTGFNGYIDIYISLPASSHVQLSSVQVVPVFSDIAVNYNLNSTEREEALLGSYYLPELKKKQIPSYLVGWDFTVNPFQFGASGTINTTPAYICDQTIAVSETSNVAYARDAATNGLQFTTGGTNDAFYIMQYLSGGQVHDMIGNPLAVNVFGYKGSVGSTVTMQVYLLRGSSSATIPTLPAVLGIIDTSGNFTLTASNWTVMARSGLDTAKAVLNSVSSNDQIVTGANDYGFSQWQIIDATNLGNTDKFAIIVTFGYVTTSTVITMNSISVVPGNIPSRPAIQSFDQVLAQCQHYYEISGNVGDVLTSPGTTHNTQWAVQGGQSASFGVTGVLPRQLFSTYQVTKRKSPNINLFALDGTQNSLTCIGQNGTSVASSNAVVSGTGTNWSLTWNGTRGFSYSPNDTTVNATTVAVSYSAQFTQIIAAYQYYADARLGIV